MQTVIIYMTVLCIKHMQYIDSWDWPDAIWMEVPCCALTIMLGDFDVVGLVDCESASVVLAWMQCQR